MQIQASDATEENVGQPGAGTEAQFAQTHWTLVLAAADRQADGADQALEELCRAYWYPLYAFLRRSGRSPHDAQDLVQGFFVHLLAKVKPGQVRRSGQARFRSFLLACLKHYAANRADWDRSRSPQQPLLSIDEVTAEGRYGLEPVDIQDPARVFERRWAYIVIEQTLARLKEACVADGKADLFEALTPYLTGDAQRGDHARVAARLGMSEGAIRVAVSRLRAEYRGLLLKEIARTVEDRGCERGSARAVRSVRSVKSYRESSVTELSPDFHFTTFVVASPIGDCRPLVDPGAQRSFSVGFAPGRLLQERYVLEGELGRGGMGRVFLGRDGRLDPPVAIKVIALPGPQVSDGSRL